MPQTTLWLSLISRTTSKLEQKPDSNLRNWRIRVNCDGVFLMFGTTCCRIAPTSCSKGCGKKMIQRTLQMARKTDGEKIDELEKLMAILLDREGATRARVDQLHTEMKELAASVAELKTAVALLQHDVAEMKKQQEEASKKYWSLLPPLVNAVLSGI